VLGGPSPAENRTAQHLASVRLPPVLPGRLTEREFAAFLGPGVQLGAIAAVTQEAFPLSANRRCNGRQAERTGVTPRFARAILMEEALVRRILSVAIAFAALSMSNAGVRADGTWCAHYGTGLEGMNCGFYSFEQCRATVSGVGGFCQANISAPAAKEPRRRYRRNY
jgi:hypothetical protein